jgi:hypothetical protein
MSDYETFRGMLCLVCFATMAKPASIVEFELKLHNTPSYQGRSSGIVPSTKHSSKVREHVDVGPVAPPAQTRQAVPCGLATYSGYFAAALFWAATTQ